MSKARVKVPKSMEKRAFQEAGARCSFCDEAEVSALQVHHIDGDPANNVLDNLFVACASCHAKVTAGIISEADVRAKKRGLAGVYRSRSQAGLAPVVQVTITDSQFRGDIAQNMTKIVTRGSPRVAHPPGSLGADLRKKGYVDYLISQYFRFKKADASYGVRRPSNPAEIHVTIQREFGHKTFFMPVEFFDRLVEFLCRRIDQTVLGRNNRSRGVRNYHTFGQHLAEQRQ